MNLKIAISSGKGGTGKTFISTNIARCLEESHHPVRYIDCDVEEPNGHLFLNPEIDTEEVVSLLSPVAVDEERCISCGICADACRYNAITMVKEKVLIFQNLCHICGACGIVCPKDAVIEKERVIGRLRHGHSGRIDFHYGLLQTAEGGMSVRMIKAVKKSVGDGINILDSPPGTACPVVETVKDADLCVLVTDPTPFGIHDLKLAADMCRAVGKEPVVAVNRAEYFNDDLKTFCRDESLEIIVEIPDDRAIAECYSKGGLAVEKLPRYRVLFDRLAEGVVDRSMKKNSKIRLKSSERENQTVQSGVGARVKYKERQRKTRELVVISGKGGTGKTSLVASFCALEERLVIADCDVDAADLHLLLHPKIEKRGTFSGGDKASIDVSRCTGCGECIRQCRFDAVREIADGNRTLYEVDPLSCEGCRVCGLVCSENAVSYIPVVNGEWYLSGTRFGPLSHARLGTAEENSGKLVTLVRRNKEEPADRMNLRSAVIDGSPGTGCPVIASVTGADYALVITEPTVSGIHDLKRIIDVIRFFKIPSGVLVNKSDLNPEKAEEIRALTAENEADFLGMIPYDKRMTEAQVRGLSLVEYTDGEITRKIESIWNLIKARCFQDKE